MSNESHDVNNAIYSIAAIAASVHTSVMSTKKIALTITIASLLFAVQSPAWAAPQALTAIEAEQRAFNAINIHRESVGAEPLVWNEEIAKIAREHSINMLNHSVPFGHRGFKQRVNAVKAKVNGVQGAGENVAFSTFERPVRSVVRGWLESDGHRENIERPGYNYTGIGVARQGRRFFFTQVFVRLR